MELHEVIDDKPQYILSDKYEFEDVYYGGLKRGYIGEIVEEFKNPLNITLVVLKVSGYRDYYKCIAKSALKKVEESKLRPFITWIYLPSEVNKSIVRIKGQIIGFKDKTIQLQNANDTIEFRSGDEINLEIDTSKGVNKTTIVIKEEGLDERKYLIGIKNSKIFHKEIKHELVESEIFINYSQSELKKLLNNSVTQNYFSPSDKIDSLLNINGDSVVKGEFSFFLLKAKKYLNSIECQIEIEEEIQKFHTEIKSKDGEEMFTHQISVNKNKFKIFEGFLSSESTFEIYIKSLRRIIDTILQENLKAERTGLFTGLDGIYLTMLTTEKFIKLEEICANLENEFEKEKSD